jgi:hypothetical protein
MTNDEQEKSVLRPEGVRRLLEGRGDDLTDDERVLLLAFLEVDGNKLDAQERAALDKLKAQVEDYDADDLVQAVQHMVKAEPVEERQLEWPELKSRRRRRTKKK